MGFRDRRRAGLARQLGRPEGLRGRLLGRALNEGNRQAVTAAVRATGLQAGQVGADVGFGGGLGLRQLLDHVGPDGHVHGVELSDTMLAGARRRHRGDLVAGRMTLQKGVLQDLPLETGRVDGLITVNTLYFVDDLDRTFDHLARVLAPTGRAVIGVADPEWMATQPLVAHGFRVRPVEDLVTGLHAAGLDVREETLDDHRSFRLLIATLLSG